MKKLLGAVRTSVNAAREKAGAATSGRRRISGIPFILALVMLLGVGMVGVLLFNTRIQDQQRQLDELQASAQRLDYHEAALEQSVDQLGTTDTLGAKAANLGMVPNPNPLVIQMPQGSVNGKPQAADGTAMPGIAVPSTISSATPTYRPASPTPTPTPGAATGTPTASPTEGR
ncbi:hypothetical protein [Propionibacterium freudenreichii]|uniref:hypothetical protein n=1 Tax=Propionibacterium freudenreichii TaxID=1744 RepID=UPI0021A8B370|nr:hypothetical protein [Propionibacterium freudenreichii]MCT2979804.1 hypothetical protein [Propionibacterium freudenreichii]MDK9671453.1 hypothetical protein [Propionibacterium freudenreichii]MDK9672870.1 hypothetical protein [Propionibacterium freudenreichii]